MQDIFLTINYLKIGVWRIEQEACETCQMSLLKFAKTVKTLMVV